MANGSNCQRRGRSRAEPSPHCRRSVVYSSVCLYVAKFFVWEAVREVVPASCQLPVSARSFFVPMRRRAEGWGMRWGLTQNYAARPLGGSVARWLVGPLARWLVGSVARWLGFTWLGYPAPPSATCSDLKWAAMHCSVYAGKQSMRWKQAVIPSHTHKESAIYVRVNMCVCVCAYVFVPFASAHSKVRQSVSILHTLKVAMPIGKATRWGDVRWNGMRRDGWPGLG